MGIICDTPNDFASRVAQFFARGISEKTILLHGAMGAGKTLFVKSLLASLGGDPDLVSSPTFTLMHEYVLANQRIYHFDLYRLSDIEEFFLIGGEEVLAHHFCLIEWPDLIKPLLPQEYLDVHIDILDLHRREIHIQRFPSGEKVL